MINIPWQKLIHLPAFHHSPRGKAVQHRDTELHKHYMQMLREEEPTQQLPPLTGEALRVWEKMMEGKS